MNQRLTREEIIDKVIQIQSSIGNKSITTEYLKQIGLYWQILKYWKNMTQFKDEFGFVKKQTYSGKKYTKDELIQIMKQFESEHGFFPDCKWMDSHSKEYGLPNRKTFNNIIGSWYLVKQLCGKDIGNRIVEDGVAKVKCDDKQFLIDLINNYMKEYGKIPTLESIGQYYGCEMKEYYKKYFGSWRNALDELNLPQNSVIHYTDEQLDDYFLSFVDEYKRVPTIQDFNKTGRPSFWCYQNRFGSWAETCIHYGFSPNKRKPEYYMDDGERCDSSFEFDISTWLKSKGFTYERNVKYTKIDSRYNGNMDCDYMFELDNGEIWYVEAAGFIKGFDIDVTRASKEEWMYLLKLKYKEKLLKRNNCNYKIIFRDDLKKYKLDEVFSFLFQKGSD